MALSLYRKYRPQTFADVVGQEHIEKTLGNAIDEGNAAAVYLFCGPRGTGKTTTARLLAKALLCEKAPTSHPDGTCLDCLEIAKGTHPDVYELDAASRTGVDNVREEIISRVQFAPTRGKNKVYIIDEVHMLSGSAFNALLKTFEEPPEHVVFVLCTTDPQTIPATVISRCQRFDFRRFTITEIVGYLRRICEGENFSYSEDALEYIAAKAAGGMRDATTALEQVAVFSEGSITYDAASKMLDGMGGTKLFDLVDSIAARDMPSALKDIAGIVSDGSDLPRFVNDLTLYMRDLYVLKATGSSDLIARPSAEVVRMNDQESLFGVDRLTRILGICSELSVALRKSTDERLDVEIALTRLCRPDADLTLESLAERIERLEAGDPIVPTRRASAPAKEAPAASAQPAPQPEPTPEPQAQPEPEPAATSADAGAFDLSKLSSALATLKHDDASTGAFIQGVRLEENGGRIFLVFPPEDDFMMSMVSKPGKTHDAITKALSDAAGRTIHFECRLATATVLPDADEPADRSFEESYADDSYYDSQEEPEDIDFDSFATHNEPEAIPVDPETASELGDLLSAFGGGVVLTEEPTDNEE